MVINNYFDGKGFVLKNENDLQVRIANLKTKGITPKLISIVVGDESGALKYQELKRKAAERVGAELLIKTFAENVSVDQLHAAIHSANTDREVFGVMIQLPLPDKLREYQSKLIESINPIKDIDGMGDTSPFVAPVVLAVQAAISQAKEKNGNLSKMAVVGGEGFVGKKIVKYFKEKGFQSYSVELNDDLQVKLSDADIIISAVGKKDLIEPNMVKEGVVLIDVGAPFGDIAKETYEKASFVSPVPGGVGPVTIYYLLVNLVTSSVGNSGFSGVAGE